MVKALNDLHVANDELVRAEHMTTALTAGRLVFGDGATQVFTADGKTVYTEGGRASDGEWTVLGEDGKFSSFWPPDYRATYLVRWVVGGDGTVAGVTFTEVEGGSRFEGRYL